MAEDWDLAEVDDEEPEAVDADADGAVPDNDVPDTPAIAHEPRSSA